MASGFTKRFSYFAALFLLIFVALYAYNRNARPLKTTVQVGYEAWLRKAELSLKNADAEFPDVTIRLASNKASAPLNWELSTHGRPGDTAKLLRILRLIREANVFSAGSSLFDRKSAGPVMVSVSAGAEMFKADMTEEQLSEEPAGPVFLKLFEIYAAAPLPAATVPDKQKQNPAR